MMFSTTFFVGCSCGGNGDGGQGNGGQGGGGTPPPPPTPTIELKADKLILTVGEYSKVTATNYVTVEGQNLVFTSANPNAIKIDSQGNVEAIAEGDSIVSVTYGEAKAQIKMTSTFNGFVPELLIDGLLTRNLSNVDTDQINPYVYFNGRRFGFDDGLTVNYTSTNTNLLTVDQNGVVSGVAGAIGDATVVVTATWRGFNGESTFSMKKEIDYRVDVNTIFTINGDTASTYEVYTKAEFGGQNYENVIDFNCIAKYGEETISAEDITVSIANQEMASFENGKLTGKAFGEDGKTTVTLSFVKNDVTYTKIVPLTVIRPITSYADRIKYFSTFTGDYKDESNNFKDTNLIETIFGTTPITDVYQGDVRLTEENGKILGVVGNFDTVADVTLRIGTQTERYDVSVDVYTKVIHNKNDIKKTFDLERSRVGTFVTGYCEMIADVDLKGTEAFYHRAYLYASAANRTPELGGFRGVFNGNGHTIKNLTTYSTNPGGMFLYIQGYQGNTPVIKNVAFDNVKFGSGGGSVMALSTSKQTLFENIYIKIADDNTGLVKGALVPNYSEGSVFMKNVFVNVPTNVTINPVTDGSNDTDNMHLPLPEKVNGSYAQYTGNSKYGFGSLFSSASIVKTNGENNFDNVHVVSPMPLIYYEGNDITFSVSKLDGYKDGNDPTLTIKTVSSNKTTEVIRYNPYYYGYGANQTQTWNGKEIPSNSTFQNYEKFSVKLGANYYTTIDELVNSGTDLSKFATDEGEFWIIKNGVPTWRSMDKESYYTTENGKLNSSTIVLNEDKKHTSIGVTNYTDVDFDITNAVSNSEYVTATINSDGKTITLNVVDGYEDWDNAKNIQITVTFDTDKTLVANVKLTSVIEKINDEVLFSSLDGVFHGNNVVAHSDIVEAYQVKDDGSLSTLNLTKEGYILGTVTNITNGFKDVGYIKIRIVTVNGKQYQFNKVKAYTGILTNGQHLKWFGMETASDKNSGHYIVANNIDANNVGVTHAQYPDDKSPYNQIISTAPGGFQGIFDGRGYTIDKMFSFRSGLFGRVFSDEQGTTEIKNVAFTNVSLDSLAKTLDNGKQHAAGPLFARFTPDSVLELDESTGLYVAKYQTLIENVYIQTKVPNVGSAYQGGLFFGIFGAYCEYNLVGENPLRQLPSEKRSPIVSFKVVDCFFDYTNSNEHISTKNPGSSGGGLITSGSGAYYKDAQGNYHNLSEEHKNSRYENLMLASKYPISVARYSQDIPGYPECPTKVLISEMGPGLIVTYASNMAGEQGYVGWKWIPYEVALADRDRYNEAILNGHLPSYMAERGIDYRVCGEIAVFDEVIEFANNPAVDNDINKGTFFYTNVKQYGTLDKMAAAYTADNTIYNGYDTAYWTVANGKLAWKTAA